MGEHGATAREGRRGFGGAVLWLIRCVPHRVDDAVAARDEAGALAVLARRCGPAGGKAL